jgi:hypothetical protein
VIANGTPVKPIPPRKSVNGRKLQTQLYVEALQRGAQFGKRARLLLERLVEAERRNPWPDVAKSVGSAAKSASRLSPSSERGL